VFFGLGSEENGGGDDGIMVEGGFHVGFFSGFFGSNESSGFGSNIGEHSGGNFSLAGLGIENPSVDAGSGANRVFFVTGHASLSGFTPTAVDVGSTEVAVLDSETKFVVVHFRKVAVVFVSDGSVDGVPQNSVSLSSILVSNDGIFGYKCGLGTVGGSLDFSAKVVVELFSLGGNWQQSGRGNLSGNLGLGLGLASFKSCLN